jgi:hypothetical protein
VVATVLYAPLAGRPLRAAPGDAAPARQAVTVE